MDSLRTSFERPFTPTTEEPELPSQEEGASDKTPQESSSISQTILGKEVAIVPPVITITGEAIPSGLKKANIEGLAASPLLFSRVAGRGRGRSGSWQFMSGQEDPKLIAFMKSKESCLRRASVSNVVHAPSEKKSAVTPKKRYLVMPSVIGLEKVVADPDQGIPAKHLMGLASCLKIYKGILGLRPFARIAMAYALSGKKSKGLGYKPKSSTWGPHAALLPLKQCYSKLHGRSESEIVKYQEYAHALREEAVPLKLDA